MDETVVKTGSWNTLYNSVTYPGEYVPIKSCVQCESHGRSGRKEGGGDGDGDESVVLVGKGKEEDQSDKLYFSPTSRKIAR